MDHLRSGQRGDGHVLHSRQRGQQPRRDGPRPFAGKKGVAGSWRVNRIDWVPTANVRQGQYQWCPISDDHPDGACWNETEDANQRQRIWNVIYSMGADQNVVREWNITAEQAGSLESSFPWQNMPRIR